PELDGESTLKPFPAVTTYHGYGKTLRRPQIGRGCLVVPITIMLQGYTSTFAKEPIFPTVAVVDRPLRMGVPRKGTLAAPQLYDSPPHLLDHGAALPRPPGRVVGRNSTEHRLPRLQVAFRVSSNT